MTRERPTRKVRNDNFADYTEHHPAYAVIGAARVRVGGGTQPLFGSDFGHTGMVAIRIQHAMLSRGLHSDRVHATGEPIIVEVMLSEAQWATFVSTLNMGEGVPATLERLNGYEVPGIEPETNRREQFNAEIADTLNETIAMLQVIADKAPTQKMKREVELVMQQLHANLPFAVKQFDEHAEETIEKAKIEVSAYVTGALQRAGLTALTGGGTPAPETFGLAMQEGDDV